MSTILGIGGFDHDGAVTLVRGDTLVGHLEWERVSRRRFAGLRSPEELALLLAATGWDLSDVDVIAWADQERYEDPAAAGLRAFLKRRFWGAHLEVVEHHRCHLASAYFASGFEHAAVLSIDGKGDAASAALARGAGAELRMSTRQPSASSIGRTWHALSIACGYPHFGAAGKVMALAAYGRPRFLDALLGWTALCDDGTFTFTAPGERPNEGPSFRRADRKAAFFCSAFDVPPRQASEPMRDAHADLAASVQAWTEIVVEHLARAAVREAGSRRLCLAGGVALNVLSNSRLLDAGIVDELFVQPAAGDDGLSLGAALALAGRPLSMPTGIGRFDPYLGRTFGPEAVERVLWSSNGLTSVRHDDVARPAAEALARGEILGWVSGREETGPRALGARSLLASPFVAGMRDRINRIKGREPFRPVALLVDECVRREAFTGPVCPYMLRSAKAHSDHQARFNEGLHRDGTSRLQIVDAESPPELARLLETFGAITGTAALVNTSLNGPGEPLVGRPEEAIALLSAGRLDALFIEGFEVRRA
ncbi:carbamoyltransferase C-terminal domain-containing protein [Polyangium sp. 6x1]|uniref:carbamoyltransferase C-terminal domain-containing protein n=1 Tax=Polyangium sp. 6x1 TaxID=3042689 RepID=UPI0024822C97|nr:carbamoyltransferase C-terminal domain-containing protein [Polyangium sp. 6x1]MDI1443603.1 carbamoyltransferase C-terminal domain-containing protein [Polyangium sp. 6x1]